MDTTTTDQLQALNRPVLAMLILINSVKPGLEQNYTVEALAPLAFRMWQWNIEKFTEEFKRCSTWMAESGAQVSYFIQDGELKFACRL